MAHSPEVNANAHLWPIVQGATEARLTTGALWDELKAFSAQPGKEYGPGVWSAINQMRSIAIAQRNGWERFARDALGRNWRQARGDPGAWLNLHPAAPDTIFTSDHAAPEFNMRDPSVRDIFPRYLARFRLDFIDANGDQQSALVSTLQPWRPGMSIADVVDDVKTAANNLSNEYGQALVGFSDVRPVTV